MRKAAQKFIWKEFSDVGTKNFESLPITQLGVSFIRIYLCNCGVETEA
jgi:hypothetical protein